MIGALAVTALAVGTYMTIRGARIRREEEIAPGPIAELRFQFLAEEEPAVRQGLGRALAIVSGDGDDSPEVNFAEIVGELGRYAFATGDTRSDMLEAFAAALDHPERAEEIERAVWTILEGDNDV